MRLLIDGVEVALHGKEVKLPGFNTKSMSSCAGQREGAILRLEVEVDGCSRQIFGYADEPYATPKFNDEYHYGELVDSGIVLFSGVASYCSTEYRDGKQIFHIMLRSAGADWADSAATTRLKDTPLVCQREMTLWDIVESWSDDSSIKMFPVHRDSYPELANTGLYEVQSPLQPHDYHPFLSVKEILRLCFESGGYKLKSRFFDSELCSKLMMSGAYRSVKVEQARATMGFKAVRTVTTTAEASSTGRVDAWVPMFGSNVGAVVDTVSPTAQDDEGGLCSEAYTNGGCMVFEDDVPTFRPKRDVNVAFDVRLRYKTEYRITSSSSMRGFTNISLGNGCYVTVALTNPYIDRRESAAAATRYKLFIFDYDPTAYYRLSNYGTITSRVSTVSFAGVPTTPIKLYIATEGSSGYVPYEGDWALYDGHVEEYGEQEVDVTIRTPFERCTPSSPKVFNDIYFEGAEQGQRLTLLSHCSIEPVFSGAAGYGELIGFEDVANHDISQADLIDALVHMFNLRIYTHEPSKSVYIEPYDDFFGGEVVDWQAKQCGDNLLYEECAKDGFMITRLGYQSSDGAVGNVIDQSDGDFGLWNYHAENYAAKQSVDSRLNPLFHPTASGVGFVGSAPSAEVLVVGDRDLVNEADYITPRIVLYHGVRDLPPGEVWPSPHCDSCYPLVAFHSTQAEESLCFEDRDGVSGLNRYYLHELEENSKREMFTTDILLPAEQYVALFDPNTPGANICSVFRLRVGGGTSLFRLDSIISYDPATSVARCRFKRLLRD